MGRRLMHVWGWAVVIGLCAVARGQMRDFDIPIPDAAPVVDGAMDAVWSIASVQYMTIDIGEGPRSDDQDCSGSFRVLHDSDYLYVFIDVNDEAQQMDNPLADGYQDDSAEFYFDGDNSKGIQGDVGLVDFQYRFNWNPDAPDSYFYEYFHRPQSMEGVEYMMAETDTGYRFEIRFPWSTLMGTSPIPMGKLVGIDCYINDDDDGAGRDHQVAWHSTGGAGWNTPSMWGTALVIASPKACGPNPTNGATGVQVPLLKWTAGAGAGFHNVYLGTTPDLGPDQLVGPRQALAMLYYPPGFQPGTTYYWRVDEVAKDGVTVVTGDVWSFTTQAETAYLPSPPDGANPVSPTLTLTWQPGQAVVQHHLYLGLDANAVTEGTADTDQGLLDDTTFALSGLEGAKTYFWRVDEVIAGGAIKTGAVWSFTTWLPIDDFESYNEEEGMGTRIYETWIDGWTNGTGSTVGYVDPPFTEQTVIHGGAQAMPLDYNNVNAPFYSEADLEFAPAQDWTAEGTDTLMLYFRGKLPNATTPLYIAVKDSSNKTAVITHPDAEAVNAVKWVEWKIPLSDLTDAGVKVTAVKQLTIGVGDKAATASAGFGLLYIDDICLTKPTPTE